MKSKPKRILVAAALACLTGLVFTLGCARTMTTTELREASNTTAIDTLGSIYYLGRKGGHDYFRLQWNVGSQRVKVAFPNDVVPEPFPYGGTPIVVGPHGDDRWLP